MNKLEALLNQFQQAISRLEEALKEPKSGIVRDSAIQRFEFTLDLSWKTAKTFLQEKKGLVCVSPKECFREAYKQGLIEYDDQWLALVDMRNETVHTYNEEVAEKIYNELPRALELFNKLLAVLRK